MGRIVPADAKGIAMAAALLREGGCVAFPTETVYGLGADATQDKAVAAIYAAKGRPHFNPLIVHVARAAQLDGIVEWNGMAQLLAQRFWLPSLAVRVPDHAVAQALLEAAGKPLAAPSANRSGRLSPTTPLHVQDSLGDAAPLILAGGKTAVGVESTIVDVTGETAAVLRYGGVSVEQIEACLGQAVRHGKAQEAADRPAAPGQLVSHYAPRHAVRLHVTTARDDEGFLLFGPELGLRGGKVRYNLSPGGDLHEAAANLFAMLHLLDREAITGIAVSAVPEMGLGRAINDRLRRAAAPPAPPSPAGLAAALGARAE